MNKRLIPEAAVEAAAVAWVGKQVWQDCNDEWRDYYVERIREILEAATPHLMAQAWDEAIQLADDEGCLLHHQAKGLKAANPYRGEA